MTDPAIAYYDSEAKKINALLETMRNSKVVVNTIRCLQVDVEDLTQNLEQEPDLETYQPEAEQALKATVRQHNEAIDELAALVAQLKYI